MHTCFILRLFNAVSRTLIIFLFRLLLFPVHSPVIKRYCARVWPWNIPKRMLNNSFSPPGERTFAFVTVYITSNALTNLSGIPYACWNLISSPQYKVFEAFLKSTKIIVAESFLSLMPSINCRRGKIGLVLVLPGLNSFWVFFLCEVYLLGEHDWESFCCKPLLSVNCHCCFWRDPFVQD